MEPSSTRVPAADGLALRLLEWSPNGVPFVLVHGYGNEAHIWDDFAPAVAPHYRTLALDLRGHGDSDWDSERRYAYADHLRDLEAVTRALEINRLVLVGHSFGGRVAMLFAGSDPERMAGLVIVDAGPELDARGVTRIRLDAATQKDVSFSSMAEYARALSLAYPAAAPHVLERMAKHGSRRREDGRLVPKLDPGLRESVGSRETPEAALERERETTAALWSALERTRCPTLVVRGAASDVLSPETADRMVEEALPHGRLSVVPQAGHSVMTDNPEGFRDAVTAFVLG